MAVGRLLRRCALVVGGAMVIAATGGCAGQAGTNSDAPPTASAPASPGALASPPSSSGQTSASTSPFRTSRPGTTGAPSGGTPCDAGELKVSLGPSNGAAGSIYQQLLFKNVSDTTCVVRGFPGVSFVGGPSGHQIGVAADRSGSVGAPVTLAPGQVASTTLQKTDPTVYSPSQCNPENARGYRVYLPGDTAAQFVPFGNADGSACGSTTLPGGPQLLVQSIVAGS